MRIVVPFSAVLYGRIPRFDLQLDPELVLRIAVLRTRTHMCIGLCAMCMFGIVSPEHMCHLFMEFYGN
ncbi:unnamed protein product [Bursaphelenchus okinawaensis]|uniref:Uncharacterized protein n=1 Tax=Bursaphelenchus okinawaensis TaxID=465554 RepID=A0A811KB55_9BILA|nr:unnamed protein product [Bursaphelenchus okinawaensis]CAG9095215.1 unnamed protein product [Bursaphelenchus okinawaensis]